MAVTTAVGLPLLQMLIRDNIAAHSGMAAVGLLQGVMRISDMYLGVRDGVFSMYFFPRFSEISNADELSARPARPRDHRPGGGGGQPRHLPLARLDHPPFFTASSLRCATCSRGRCSATR
jgi:hypothetical protein